MCGSTRLLVPAFLVGFAVATVFANDAYGWIAAGLTIAILSLVAKLRGTAPTCAISLPPPVHDDRADAHSSAPGEIPSA